MPINFIGNTRVLTPITLYTSKNYQDGSKPLKQRNIDSTLRVLINVNFFLTFKTPSIKAIHNHQNLLRLHTDTEELRGADTSMKIALKEAVKNT